jgi:hypothetical protein
MWFDVKWRRPGDPEILEWYGLTGEQLAFRLRGVIQMCRSIELISVTFATGPAKYEAPSNAGVLSEDSGIGGA